MEGCPCALAEECFDGYCTGLSFEYGDPCFGSDVTCGDAVAALVVVLVWVLYATVITAVCWKY